MAVSKKIWFWLLLPVTGVAATLAAPQMVAWYANPEVSFDSAGAVKAERMVSPQEADYLLVVARREERMAIDDPTPHRNSRVALYRRGGKRGWERQTESLPIRSTATAQSPKRAKDSLKADVMTRYGFTNVPLGVFTLHEGVWRDRKTPAYLISDWNRWDGSIHLAKPQVIRIPEETDDEGNVTDYRVLRSSWGKSGCWIHYTRTTTWSHGDSDGCMNLYRTVTNTPEVHDYDVFISWFQDRDLSPGPEGDLMALAVVPYVMAANEVGLKQNLCDSFLDEVRNLQGRQLEDME